MFLCRSTNSDKYGARMLVGGKQPRQMASKSQPLFTLELKQKERAKKKKKKKKRIIILLWPSKRSVDKHFLAVVSCQLLENLNIDLIVEQGLKRTQSEVRNEKDWKTGKDS